MHIYVYVYIVHCSTYALLHIIHITDGVDAPQVVGSQQP